jgi:hypothetical protein
MDFKFARTASQLLVGNCYRIAKPLCASYQAAESIGLL